MDMRNQALNYAKENYKNFQLFLGEIISIPSISTSPENINDMKSCAAKIMDKLQNLGFNNIQLFETPKHPIIYADYLHADPSKPTLLIYGHYDVQPVDPVELWTSDPFKARVDGDYLYSRGSSDMKGQIVACLAAIESILSNGPFPVNLKYIIEGEEEIGSPNLKPFLESHKDLLKADVAVNPDCGMIGIDIPTIVYGLRGLAYFELRVFGPDHDLHSGVFGGVVHNPAQVLIDLISKMHDLSGRITLPHFYDDVVNLSEDEKKELRRLNLDEKYYKSQTGVANTWGESGYSLVERIGARPTLEVNGFLSGFTGTGAKTIIPSKAMAKISTRLVPNQDPNKVHQQLLEFVKQNIPNTVHWELDMLSGGNPSISDITIPETIALSKALETVWGKKPIYKREGGSVPVVADMQQILGIDSVLTGFGLPDDNIHSPNERLHLPTWHKGIDALIHFFMNLE